MRGTVGWFVFPAVIAIAVVVGFIVIGRDLGLVAWPFAAAAVIFGLFAWWLYEADGAERSLLRGMVASMLIAITVYAVIVPVAAGAVSERADRRRVARERLRAAASRVAAGYQEPSLVFLLGTDTRFTDGAGAAEFLRQGAMPLRADRGAQRAQLRAARRGDRPALRARASASRAINISIGRPVSIAVFRSTETP